MKFGNGDTNFYASLFLCHLENRWSTSPSSSNKLTCYTSPEWQNCYTTCSSRRDEAQETPAWESCSGLYPCILSSPNCLVYQLLGEIWTLSSMRLAHTNKNQFQSYHFCLWKLNVAFCLSWKKIINPCPPEERPSAPSLCGVFEHKSQESGIISTEIYIVEGQHLVSSSHSKKCLSGSYLFHIKNSVGFCVRHRWKNKTPSSPVSHTGSYMSFVFTQSHTAGCIQVSYCNWTPAR